jgi:uncharacterized protein
MLPPDVPDPNDTPLPGAARARLERLYEVVESFGSVAVAFSAGVDSTLVLKACADRLGPAAVAFVGVSASLPRAELDGARDLARFLGVRLVEVATQELEQPGYRANPSNRCYFCKDELYGRLRPLASRLGLAVIADGFHVDDQGDRRPGARAAEEAGVRHPLLEAGLGKEEIRTLARFLGLPNWDKPALACLSSRVPHGAPIDAALLARIEQAELGVHRLGFRACRARVHGDAVRLEFPPGDLERAFAGRTRLVEAVRAAGFRFVSLDLEGYRTGPAG